MSSMIITAQILQICPDLIGFSDWTAGVGSDFQLSDSKLRKSSGYGGAHVRLCLRAEPALSEGAARTTSDGD